jgi:cobaltochelatase CobT
MNQLQQDLLTLLYGDGSLGGSNLLRKASALHRAIPLIAQSLVENSGKKIRIRRQSGAGGATDGQTVWLMDGVLPREANDVDRFLVYVALKIGLVHHEVGHVNETDFDFDRRSLDPLANKLLGIIEDVRQENAHIRRFKAGRKYLDALSLASMITGLNGAIHPDEPLVRVFTGYLLFTLRWRYRNEPHFMELAEGARRILIDRLDRSIVARIEAHFSRVAMLKDTADAADLAQDLSILIREEEKKAQQQKQQRQQQQQGQAQQQASGDGSSPDDAQPDGNGDGGDGLDDDASQPDDGTPGDTDTSPDDSGDPSGGKAGQDDDGDLPDDATLDRVTAGLDELLNGDLGQAMGDLDEQVRQAISALQEQIEQDSACTHDEADIETVLAAREEATTNLRLSPHAGDFNEAISAVGRLSSRLKKQLQAQSFAKTGRAATGTHISRRHLAGVALGDARIFRRTHTGTATDTAVFLLGDVSGSMGGDKIRISNQSMYACALAMQRIPGIDVAVGAFPGQQMVLRFGERAQQHQRRFDLAVHGCTPLHEGVLMAHTALSFSRKPRKILMVLTDGEPDDYTLAQASLDYVEESGIELFAIGIQTDAVKDLFQQWTVVNQVDDLPAAMMTMLSGGLGVPLAMAS